MTPAEAPLRLMVLRADPDAMLIDVISRADKDADVVLDVSIAGRRVWSFWLDRDSESGNGARRVPWPVKLAERLTGHARLTLTVHLTREVLFDAEVHFTQDDVALDIVDHTGHPLALDKGGSLRRLFSDVNEESRVGLLDAMDRVLGVLSSVGLEAFLAYGTLLGAVREGRLLGHDHDADLGYFSEYEHPVDLMLESFRVERQIRELGYQTLRYSGFSFQVPVEEGEILRGLDVFGAFLLDGMLYHMGEVGAPMRREQILPLSTCTLEGREFPAPADAGAWLTATYGPTWQVSDPAFKFQTARATERRLAGWFRGARWQRRRWDSFYMSHPCPPLLRDVAPFAQWVMSQIPDEAPIVDVGSGWGRDVLAYAAEGHPTQGLDYSRPSSARAQEVACRVGWPASFRSFNAYDLRSVLATGTALAARSTPTHAAVRLVAEALDTGGRDGLWRLCSMLGARGGSTFLALVREGEPAPSISSPRIVLRTVPQSTIAEEIAHFGGILDGPHHGEPGVDWWTITWRQRTAALTG